MKTNTKRNGRRKLLASLLTIALLAFFTGANAQCVAAYTSSNDPLANGNVTFTNTSSSSTTYSSWNFGDGTTDGSMSPVHTFALSGTYNVCLTIYDSVGLYDSTMGCYNTYCSTIAVTNDSTPAGGGCTAYFTSYDSVGLFYHFNNYSTGTGLTTTWSFGDGTSGTSTGDIVHNYSTAGTYTVCISNSNALGTCTSSWCDSIVVGGSSTGGSTCWAGFYYSGDSLSTPTSFYSTTSGTADTYAWDFGDGSTSNLANPTHTYTTAGTYTACLTVSSTTDSTCSSTTCNTVNISTGGFLGCSAYFIIVQDTSNLFNYSVYNYSSTPSGTGSTYFWDFGDGTTSSLAYPTHTYTTSSVFYLCLTITDGAACTSTYCDSVNAGHGMLSALTLHVVNPETVGIHESEISSTFSNYPNPFNGNTTINYSISKDATVAINIVDLLGNKVAGIVNENKAAGEHTVTWNADGVSEGMYLLQMNVNGHISSKKIIVTK